MTLSASKIIDTSIKIVPALLFFYMVDASVYMLEGLMVLALIFIASLFPLRSIVMGREQGSLGGAEIKGHDRSEESRRLQIAHLPVLGLLILGLQVYQSPVINNCIPVEKCKSEQFVQLSQGKSLPFSTDEIELNSCSIQHPSDCCKKS